MNQQEKKAIYQQLSAPFTDDAIERTEARVTGRGYDTTGIKYQYVVNRLNEALGIGGWRTQQEIHVREVVTSKGRPAFDATCDLTMQLGEWAGGQFAPWAEAHATGGHTSMIEADARKGSFTNSLKKAAAMFGCGKQAYEGTLDDDNVPAEDANLTTAAPAPRPSPAQQPQPAVQQQYQQQPVQQAPRQQPPPSSLPPETYDPPEARNTPPAPSRNRLTSKQLAALWAISRKLGYEQSAFRQHVKQAYGVQPEFLDRTTASNLIGAMSARAGNGGSHPAGEHAPTGAA